MTEESSTVGTGRSELSCAGMIYLLEVPAVQVERHRTEMFREKRTRVSINDEGESGPLGEHLFENRSKGSAGPDLPACRQAGRSGPKVK